MATVVLGSIVSDIRGSIGSETYGRNQGGIFVRARTSPTQTESSERDTRNAAITDISQAWSATLSEDQRAAWRSYAKQHPLPDRFGRPRFVSGICHFTRCNAQRYRITLSVDVLDAPDEPPGPPPAFTFTAQDFVNRLFVDLVTLDYRGNPDALYLYWFCGHAQEPGRKFYNGPWRYVDYNYRVAGAWFEDPWVAINPWGQTAGQRVWTRMVAELPSHAVSIRHQAEVLVT